MRQNVCSDLHNCCLKRFSFWEAVSLIYGLFFSGFNKIWKFLDIFSKNVQISNFMKIRPLGAELLHAGGRTGGQTYMTRLTVTFRNFAHAPNNKNYRKTAGVSDNSLFPDSDQYHIFFKSSFPLNMPNAGPLRSSTMPITSPTLSQTLNRVREHNQKTKTPHPVSQT